MAITEKERPQDSLEVALQQAKSLATPNWVDRWIGSLMPEWGAKRLANRQELGYRHFMLSYAASQPTLERPMFSAPLVSEEAEMPGYDRFQLITEGRRLYRESPVTRAAIDGITKRVGVIHPHFCTDDDELNQEAYKQWCDWADNCDVRRQMTLAEMQEQNVKACYPDGDSGVQLCKGPLLGKNASGENIFDLNLDVIEGDRIAENYRTGINIDKHSPLGGVVWDIETNRIKGYLVGTRGMGGILENVQEIPEQEFILLFRRQRRDQLRGVPLLAPVINLAKDLEKYLNATRIQANIAATFGVVITKNQAALWALNQSQPAQGNANYQTMPLSTGKMVVLAPGEDIKSFQPNVPGPQFDQYAKFLVRLLAVGLGSTYEMVMHDFSGMSYSSTKTNLLTENLLIQSWHQWQINNFLKRIYAIWVAKRMEAGWLPMNPQLYESVTWQTPARVGIDPTEEATSDIELIEAGLESYTTYYKKYAKDPEREMRQCVKDKAFIRDQEKEFGLQPGEGARTAKPGAVVQPVDVND